jgi:CHAD domain-containing protein
MAFQVGRASKTRDAECVHDLRVAIRRFGQCLRAFGQFFPPGASKKIRRNLKKLMTHSSEVRNRDIALGLLAEAQEPPDSTLVRALSQDRRNAEKAFVAALKQWSARHSFRKWRSGLDL